MSRSDAPPLPTGAAQICDWLEELGVRHLFLVPGSQLHPLVRELAEGRSLRGIAACHESGAGFMADGYARGGSAPGVCAAIGGPGAINLLPAAQSASHDDSPVLFLTGDVPASLASRGAFQDAGPVGTDDGALFALAIGHSRRVEARAELGDALIEAGGRLARGRCAHLAVPIDVLAAPGERIRAVRPGPGNRVGEPAAPAALVEELRRASDVLVYVGTRLARGAGPASLRRFVEAWSFPVVTTLGAKGLLAESHPLSRGNAGYGGDPGANRALRRGDHTLLLVVGTDLDERNSLGWDRRILDGRRVVRLDDRARASAWEAFQAEFRLPDLAGALDCLAAEGPASEPCSPQGGRRAREQSPARASDPEGPLSGRVALACLREALPADGALLVDGGLGKVLAGQEWAAPRPGRFHCAAGTAPTGWAIPAGLGFALAASGGPVAVVTGDGSLLMSGMELATAARYGVPLPVLLLDNGGHAGMLRRSRPGSPLRQLVSGAPVDAPALARALGTRSAAPRTRKQLDRALRQALEARGPSLIHVRTAAEEPFRDPDSVFLSYDGFLVDPDRT